VNPGDAVSGAAAPGGPVSRGTTPGGERTPPRRPGIDALRVYRGAVAPGAIDLSDNTNRFGVPPAAAAALAAFDPAAATRYPSASNDALRAALAAYAGVAPDEVVTGCGSDDVLDGALRAFGAPGARVAFPAPTFVMIEHFARANALVPVAVPPRADGAPDLDALLAARPDIVYLCSPNNPTGARLPAGALERVLDGTRGLVILDEAYAEYAGATAAASAPARGRLLVARTMSKAFALAGLRVGWAVGAAPLVTAVEKARGPFKVGAAAEAAALAALAHDQAWVRARAAEAVACRERFAAALAGAGFAPLPSAANFVLVPVADAAAADAALRARGIVVRAFAELPGVGDALRVTVAPWPVLEPVLAALRAAAAPAAGRA
jgi:histidinol-phosphate aminotransferase